MDRYILLAQSSNYTLSMMNYCCWKLTSMLKVDNHAQAQGMLSIFTKSWANVMSWRLGASLSSRLLETSLEQLFEQYWANTHAHTPVCRMDLSVLKSQLLKTAQTIAQNYSWAQSIFAQYIGWVSTYPFHSCMLKVLKYLLNHQPWAYLLEFLNAVNNIFFIFKSSNSKSI